VVDPTLERPAVSWIVAALALVFAGILVGYRSPGRTIREAAMAGITIYAVIGAFALGVLGYPVPSVVIVVALAAAPALTMAGGWVGEVMQGTVGAESAGRVAWAWVAVGILVGFLISMYSVFLLDTFGGLTPMRVVLAFAWSFLITGFLVGWLSPGITIMEPAVAAFGVVVLDSAVAALGLGAAFPMGAVAGGVAVGFVLALGGGWLGEELQRGRA